MSGISLIDYRWVKTSENICLVGELFQNDYFFIGKVGYKYVVKSGDRKAADGGRAKFSNISIAINNK